MGACIISGTDAFVSVHCVYRGWEYNIKVCKLPVTRDYEEKSVNNNLLW